MRKYFSLMALTVCLPASLCEAQTPPAACDHTADIEGVCAAWFDSLPMNAIQAIGSHNSYHVRPTAPELKLIEHLRPGNSAGWDYGNKPLKTQLDLGLRQIELDLYYDPKGGRYADPLGPRLTANTRGFEPYDARQMTAPGFKVMHMQDIDVRSTCPTLKLCLGEIRTWSETHPDHAPLLIMFNTKQEEISYDGVVKPLAFDLSAFADLETEIASVFSRDHILTPDDVRRGEATLPLALKTYGWPTLRETRGKVFFLIDESETVTRTYMGRHKALEGQLLFVKSVSPEAAHAAVFVENDPLKSYEKIKGLVSSGFIVRTRADASLKEARANDPTRKLAALNSGAQYVTTDLYQPRTDLSDYVVTLPGGQKVRLNPRVPEATAAGAHLSPHLPKSVQQ
ncbi:Ca2+-dependent phosphoinositide-specific phospholipase C [Asticcacaulis sp. SL142]|uniref:Ca2+-dependent phosphoinositide-specific phospholipase C n=1 Tax=Asticcacaulis sp. SL142 TaxID=2995155 RepID=UPI00226CBCEC|nr:Ca2+-dependent phosphoinositide-specific phospholipase C [Asticcacaulis sp. SL142]WAC47790.1 Ca2+-dependent phosphoinositide-specific phospholipase C [Asticcacaulis sp. SL142]